MGAPAAPQVIGRYAVYGKVASGGMASVHLGRLIGSVGFSRTVAIKRLHPHLADESDFVATMIDEARLAARINHPNVVPTLDVVAADGELLVVMEYVRGESIARLVRAEATRGTRVPLPVVSAIVAGALHGLHAAHEATNDRGAPLGIVHRDVSPQNILVGVDGVARVIDFGVAKAVGRITTTREGVIKGKVPYMAPEQLSGYATPRVDVYAMAVVLWEILAGRRLFHAENDAALMVKVLSGATEEPSRYAAHIPIELDALVMKGLAVDPANRFASARDMAEALVQVVPPAFPTAVGAWVQGVAREALDRRSAVLAEIESSSGITIVPAPEPPLSVRRLADHGPPREADDLMSISTQTSSLGVETPAPGVRSSPRSRRAAAGAAMLGVGILLAVCAVAFAWRGRTQAAAGPVATPVVASGGSGQGTPETPPEVSGRTSPSPPPTHEAEVSPAAPTSEAPSKTAPATPATAWRPRTLPRVPASAAPAGSIRFVHPD